MFKVEVGPHQVSVLSCFLFTRVINRLTDEVGRELLWTGIKRASGSKQNDEVAENTNYEGGDFEVLKVNTV